MLRVFVGYDERQKISFTALQQSIFANASRPVAISPLILDTLPISRRGLTPFTFSRFLVPWLCDFRGPAIFMDADMLLVSDICELEDAIDDAVAVSVVRSLAQYEQTSFMLFNCAHPANRQLTPEYIETTADNLHGMAWLEPGQVGALDPVWNQLVGYQDVDVNRGNLHFTMGVPVFPETATAEGAAQWRDYAAAANHAEPWVAIMGPSVHAIEIDGVKFPRYVWDFTRNAPKPEHFNLVRDLVMAAHRSRSGDQNEDRADGRLEPPTDPAPEHKEDAS